MRFSAIETAEHWLSTPLFERVRPFASRIDAIASGEDDAAVAQRMAVVAFAIRVASAGLLFLSQAIIARWAGAFDYGIYVFVWTAMIILGSLSCLGFQTAVIRFLPAYRKNGETDLLRGLMTTSRLFVLAVATLIAVAGAAVVWLLGERIESYYVVPFVLAFTCLPMLALGEVLEGIARANNWPIRALAPTYIVRPTLMLAIVAATHVLGFEATASAAVFTAVVASYLTTILQLFVVSPDLGGTVPPGPRKTDLGQWVTVALPIFLVEGFFFMLTNADVLMVGFFRSPEEVAVYYAAVKVLALAHFVFFAVKTGVAQQFAANTAPEERAALRAFAGQTVGWTFWPTLAIGVVILVFGKFLLSLFGSGFTEGYPLLFVLIAGVVVRASVGPAESLLNMTGHQNACAAIFAIVLLLNIVLNMLFIPVYGLMGAAAASAIATVLEAALLLLFSYRRVGVVMFVWTPKRNAEAA
ncbi:polysaccharide biosynthesis C-terminal domain-containing protein [Oricola thermophila]|uniref:Lipopolysaccharide biosynthesis protein n=1 Tax=Oricola thermophila TaxID=2742145 RepID=A0A6N1VLW7_9HYPH|nr:lipopolysaccharide biosynthesis protein [Oricola thermophila]QKV20219.1 lipopolysaccharide biosynthesis protein [Oricola thermophila]